MPPIPFQAVLFDCDGVLVDSEHLVSQVLVEMLGELGWSLSLAQAMHIFTGHAVKDQAALILQHTGVSIDEAWHAEFRRRRNLLLLAEVGLVPHAAEAVAAIHAQLPQHIAVASGADLHKVKLQLDKVGLRTYFGERVFSGQDLAQNKPYPDVYLAAAQALGSQPQRCAVVEDSPTGARAGVAAGATVLGYVAADARAGLDQELRAVGVSTIFQDMRELPVLIARGVVQP